MITPNQVSAWMFGLGGRRFLMTSGAGIVNSLLFANAFLSESGYITLTGMTVGAYLAANTIESLRTMKLPAKEKAK